MKTILSTLVTSSLLATTLMGIIVGKASATPPIHIILPDRGSSSPKSSPKPIQGLIQGRTCDSDTFRLEGSTECSGPYSGNDSANVLNNLSIFGKTSWSEVAKVESGTTLNELRVQKIGDTSGDWEYRGNLDFANKTYAIAIKGGTEFATYLLGFGKTSGSWNTGDLLNGGGNIPGLSHLSLYQADGGTTPPPPAPVPEPFTFIGTAVFLGVGAFAKKKYGQK